MPKNVKHYLLTAIILGGIAAVSGAAIGLTYFVTKDQIAINAANRIKKGLAEIYPDAEFSDGVAIDGDDKYLDYYYEAKKEDNLLGYVFQVTGSNSYGKISMLVGISTSFDIGHLYLVINEQTYAQTLVDNFVTPYNKDEIGMSDADVKCGATYGGKLVREMAQEAQSWASNNLKGGQ